MWKGLREVSHKRQPNLQEQMEIGFKSDNGSSGVEVIERSIHRVWWIRGYLFGSVVQTGLACLGLTGAGISDVYHNPRSLL